MLKPLNKTTAPDVKYYPERIVQFGAGNFVRAFVDWVIQELNEQTDFGSQVVVVKVTPETTYEILDSQDCLFHVVLRGYQAGTLVDKSKLITCVSRTVYPYQDFESYQQLATQPEIRFIVSNTTEAGISYSETDNWSDEPPSSFPAKLAIFLHHRFQHFDGASDKGCIIIPTELVVNNGDQLRDMVLRYADQWELSSKFSAWINEHNVFCNTLVDRIVPGFPANDADEIFERIGYEDKQLVMGEPYHSWIIEAPESLKDEFPVHKTNLNVKIVDSVDQYRLIKVRILNGAHSSMVPVGYLLGLETVRDAVEHDALGKFLKYLVYDEIIPSMDLPEAELRKFADDVFDRFRNPHIHHRLLSIAVNSTAKIRERILPTIIDHSQKHKRLPLRMVLAFTAFIRFYKGDWHGQTIPLKDDQANIDWFAEQWSMNQSIPVMVDSILRNSTIWGQDLSQIEGLGSQISEYLTAIDQSGMLEILKQIEV